jgi:hypothetical protein
MKRELSGVLEDLGFEATRAFVADYFNQRAQHCSSVAELKELVAGCGDDGEDRLVRCFEDLNESGNLGKYRRMANPQYKSGWEQLQEDKSYQTASQAILRANSHLGSPDLS